MNRRLTADVHHLVLDFGAQDMPLLEGQAIGILTPGVDASSRPHAMRVCSVASARDGERPGSRTVALTVKRILADRVVSCLRDDRCYIYLCGVAGMKKGMELVFAQVCKASGIHWLALRERLQSSHRLHIEIY